MKSRILLLLAIFVAAFLFLLYRLFSIQIFDNKNMLQKVSAQRTISAPINSLRGKIYDKNMIPLTDNHQKTCISIIPQLINNPEDTALIISQNTEADYYSILKKINQERPFEFETDYNTALLIKDKIGKGLIVTKTTSRYGENSIASHVIGYVNSDNHGQYGIEKGYDNYLRRTGYNSIGMLIDGQKRPLPGLGFRAIQTYSSDRATNVKLTIDYHCQSIIEKTFDKYSYNGAAVLLDTVNGDVLAMVSRPNYSQNDVAKYIQSSNKELINKALYPYNLGSIFKIVVAEAALENNIVSQNDTFFCEGYIVVDGQLKKCASYNAGGHGEITFEDAFALSCNTVFIDVGLKTGYKSIIEYARKFGLGQSLGLDTDGLCEDPGLILYNQYFSNREVANISIGQGDILVTPLQAANLIAIVANDGIQNKINIVDSIIDNNGETVKIIRHQESQTVLPRENIQIIKKMMSKVIESGTGTKANLEEYGGAAGKTSSAETGIYEDGEQIIHAWFGGYFPQGNPQYAMAIVVENGKMGAQVAAPLFGEIAAQILSMGR